MVHVQRTKYVVVQPDHTHWLSKLRAQKPTSGAVDTLNKDAEGGLRRHRGREGVMVRTHSPWLAAGLQSWVSDQLRRLPGAPGGARASGSKEWRRDEEGMREGPAGVCSDDAGVELSPSPAVSLAAAQKCCSYVVHCHNS